MNISFPLFQVRKDDLHLWGYEKESTTWLFFKQKERENSRNLHFKRWEKKGAGENNSVFTSELLLLFLTKKFVIPLTLTLQTPKKTQKLKKFFQLLPEKSDWLSATIDGGPPWDFSPSLSRKKTTNSIISRIHHRGKKERELDRGNDFSSSPFALLRECVCTFGRWKIKGPLLCEERRENSISLPLVFFHGQKNEPKVSHTDPRGKKARKLHTPLSLPKCEEM